MKKSFLITTIITASLTSSVAFAEDNKKVEGPWPPVITGMDARDNWPVSHPAPSINLNEIPSGQVFNALSLKERKAIQKSLARVGYYAGNIDGIWGEETFKATRHYAKVMGFEDRLNDTHGSLRTFQHITN